MKLIDEWNAIRQDQTITHRQRWLALLALETKGRHGAPEIRQRQDKLRAQWETIKLRTAKPTPLRLYPASHPDSWANHCPEARRARWKFARARELERLSILAHDAKQGWIQTLYNLHLYSDSLKIVHRLEDFKINKSYICIQGYWIFADNKETQDWHAYSESWHRQHGPKITTTRSLEIRKFGEPPLSIPIKAWTQNVILNTLLHQNILIPYRYSPALTHYQQHVAFELEPVKPPRLYRRLLGGKLYDYIHINSDGTHYYSKTPLRTN